MEEAKANKGIRIDDPFTRRSTQPTMLFKKSTKTEEPSAMPEPIPPPNAARKKIDDKKAKANGPADNNLYSLHDFEIDLDVPLPGKPRT